MHEINFPKFFDFENTFKIIQRGPSDPINHWNSETKRWRRLLVEKKTSALVEVFCSEKIYFEVLSGSMPIEKITLHIKKLLGLDDPFLNMNLELTDNFDRLASVWPIALPGYFDLFEAIVQIILGQLISAIAANKMRERFTTKFGEFMKYNQVKYFAFPTPEKIFKYSEKTVYLQEMRNIGISRGKAETIYIAGLKFQDLDWVNCITNPLVSSQEKLTLLTSIKGIGKWTADWFFLRGLRHFTVVPTTDLVVRKALTWWWNSKDILTSDKIEETIKSSTAFTQFKGLFAYRIMCAYTQSTTLNQILLNASTEQKATKKRTRSVNKLALFQPNDEPKEAPSRKKKILTQ